jgi:alkylation response protein AidB-like acyl-CoA dehydrogenase
VAQPGNFGFGEEAALLKESARRFFAEQLPTDRLHALVAGEHDPERDPQAPWPAASWPQMVDLGWTALAVPESAGGLGLPLAAVAGLVEELGRAAFPSPLFTTLAATYVLAACGETGAAALADISAGRSATLAISDRGGSWYPGDCDVSYAQGVLNGTASFVQDPRKAERLLVSARGADGLQLFWVDATADGVSLLPDHIADLTRDQGRVSFDGVAAHRVAADGLAALEAAMPALWTLLAADMVGAAEWQLQTTAEYARSRRQFDRPLGFFQAVKHQLVDVMVRVDESKSLVYAAACAVDCEPARARSVAHMAKASASDAAAAAASRSVQCHGGIGFTWECHVHLYFKRQQHSRLLWGDAAWHRARLADLVIGEVA